MKLISVKQAVQRLLTKITRSYPPPPTSGITATITIYSSREWMDWFNNLSCDQRTQYVKDAFK